MKEEEGRGRKNEGRGRKRKEEWKERKRRKNEGRGRKRKEEDCATLIPLRRKSPHHRPARHPASSTGRTQYAEIDPRTLNFCIKN
jgi:hypothetical protein